MKDCKFKRSKQNTENSSRTKMRKWKYKPHSSLAKNVTNNKTENSWAKLIKFVANSGATQHMVNVTKNYKLQTIQGKIMLKSGSESFKLCFVKVYETTFCRCCKSIKVIS